MRTFAMNSRLVASRELFRLCGAASAQTGLVVAPAVAFPTTTPCRSMFTSIPVSSPAFASVRTTSTTHSATRLSSSTLSSLRQAMRFQSSADDDGPSAAALADVLKQEIDEEAHRAGKPVEPAPPAGWTVERTAGNATFSLQRQFQDEDILVRYTPADSTDVNYHEITAFITRRGKTLMLEVSVEEGELVLNNIAFFPQEALAKDTSAEGDVARAKLYPGPKLSELDDKVMDHFIRYLEERGINSEMGEFISLYSFWAEQQEFEGWLENVHEFTS